MKQASDCDYKLATKKLTTILLTQSMIFRREWAKLKYTLNLVRCFLLHLTKFQYFFYGFKSQLSNSYDNWYVQKYLKGIFHKEMLLIWKEYFTRAIWSFSSPRCAIIARLNVIYTKFRRAMIAQLNKIWRVWACAHAITRHLQPGLVSPGLNQINLIIQTTKFETFLLDPIF